MSLTKNIRKHLALFLLVVFALSITPKALFHDALSQHTDEIVCKDKDKTAPHFHRPVFHCSFDDLVAAAPFLAAMQSVAASPLSFFVTNISGYQPALLPSLYLHTESRGPPMI